MVSDWRGAPFGVSSFFPRAVPACGIHLERGSFYGDAFFPDKSQEAKCDGSRRETRGVVVIGSIYQLPTMFLTAGGFICGGAWWEYPFLTPKISNAPKSKVFSVTT